MQENEIVRQIGIAALEAGMPQVEVASRAKTSRTQASRWAKEATIAPDQVYDAMWAAIETAVREGKPMPTFRGYGGGRNNRPKRKRQLEQKPVDKKEPIPLATTCKGCGHKWTITVPADVYLKPDFKKRGVCPECADPV